MIELVDYDPVHVDEIMRMNPRFREFKMSILPYWEKFKEIWGAQDTGRTLIVDGKIICCGGVVIVGNQEGEAWMVGSTLICKYPKAVYSAGRNRLDEIIKTYNLKKIRALAESDFDIAKRFLIRLGFKECEPLMENGFQMTVFRRLA